MKQAARKYLYVINNISISRIPKTNIIVMFLSGNFFHVEYILYLKEPSVMNTERSKMCICACIPEKSFVEGLRHGSNFHAIKALLQQPSTQNYLLYNLMFKIFIYNMVCLTIPNDKW